MNSSECSRPLVCAHAWVASVVQTGDYVVDATAGNGHDTLFLAQLVGPHGQIDVFDVQEAALISTQQRLVHANCWYPGIRFHALSHSHMATIVKPGVRCIMFNLGYLPGGDHNIRTQAESTLTALEQATKLVTPGGLISVVCYPGHHGGREESKLVSEWMKKLDPHSWRVSQVAHWNAPGDAPFLLAAFRLHSASKAKDNPASF